MEVAGRRIPNSEALLSWTALDCRFGRPGSGDRAALNDPPGRLAAEFGNGVVVAVVVQDRDSTPLGDGGDQEIGARDGSHPARLPELFLDLECALPVDVLGGEQFVAGGAVGVDRVVLGG